MIRNRIIYLCLLLYGFVFAILYNTYETFILVLLLFFIPIILMGILGMTTPFVQVEVLRNTNMINQGEIGNVYLRVKNRSIFPVACARIRVLYGNEFVSKKGKELIQVFVDGNSEQEISFQLEMLHSGNVKLVFDCIYIYDYFRIFCRKKKIKEEFNFFVLPQIKELDIVAPIAQNLDLEESDTFSKYKSGDDPSEVFDIREYQFGDKIHRIHWKLSSKKNSYMVKEFSQPITCSTVILLELYYQKIMGEVCECMDKLLAQVLSLSYTFILQHHIHYIAWYDRKEEEIKRFYIETEEDIYEATEELLRMQTYEMEEVFSDVYVSMYQQEKIANWYYIGWLGTSHFEEHGIQPQVVELYGE